ncbi:unnamed protein product [Hermetia illucens]|uniref:Uncharacterized protein n=1 Tax=Hermetia illucens TaxID=343691 RepID=A0A7R8UXX4_HERIL|nr:unnamed protein product [Hermetia illucens]
MQRRSTSPTRLRKKMEENQYLTIENNEQKILRENDSDNSDFEDNLQMDDFAGSDIDSEDEEDEDAIVSDEIRKTEEVEAKAKFH